MLKLDGKGIVISRSGVMEGGGSKTVISAQLKMQFVVTNFKSTVSSSWRDYVSLCIKEVCNML